MKHYLLLFFLSLFFLSSASLAAPRRKYPLPEVINSILNDDFRGPKIFQGPEGYVRFADRYFYGNMQQAFLYTNRAVSSLRKNRLAWGRIYGGSTKDYKKERSKLFKDASTPHARYVGNRGYRRYADKYYDGNMTHAYNNALAVLNDSERKLLSWGNLFRGSTSEYLDSKMKILDNRGQVKKAFLGPLGYLAYADQHHNGSMDRAYSVASAILDRGEFTSLNWGKRYNGTTEKFTQERELLLTKQGKPRSMFFGVDGYVLYSDTYYKGQMLTAYLNMSAVLSTEEKNRMQWGPSYPSSTQEFLLEKQRLLKSHDKPIEAYVGKEGYVSFAEDAHKGNMRAAYNSAKATLDKDTFLALDWGKTYTGTSHKFIQDRTTLLDENGKPHPQYQGKFGYAQFAEEAYRGNMATAHHNISAALTKEEWSLLKWGAAYEGTTLEFHTERDRLFNNQGQLRAEFIGLGGYLRYTDAHYQGRMKLSASNVKVVLSQSEWLALDWGNIFYGSTQEFKKARDLLFSKGYRHAIELYFGKLDGLNEAAQKLLSTQGVKKPVDADYIKARKQLRGVTTMDEIKMLGWDSNRSTKLPFIPKWTDLDHIVPASFKAIEGPPRCSSLF